jgi:hypothetical protein
VFKHTRLRVLPIGRAGVQAMLDELHGKALPIFSWFGLQGTREPLREPHTLEQTTALSLVIARAPQCRDLG